MKCNNDKQCLVSILIPVYNRELFIKECLESACAQSYENIEIIVVDNASTDHTYDICAQMVMSDTRIKLFRNEKNLGPVLNWQRCIEAANGQYSKFLFSDDLISSDFIEHTVKYLEDDEVGFVFTKTAIGKEPEASNTHIYNGVGDSGKYKCLHFIQKSMLSLDYYPVSPGCAIFRTDSLRKNICLNITSEKTAAFLDNGAGPNQLLYLLTAVDYPNFVFIDEPLAFFRIHDNSITVSDAQSDYVLPSCYYEAQAWFYENVLKYDRLENDVEILESMVDIALRVGQYYYSGNNIDKALKQFILAINIVGENKELLEKASAIKLSDNMTMAEFISASNVSGFLLNQNTDQQQIADVLSIQKSIDQGQLEQAIENINSFLKTENLCVSATIAVSECMFACGLYSEAVSILDTVLLNDPGNAEALNNIATIKCHLNIFVSALICIKHAIYQDSSSSVYNANYTEILKKSVNINKSINVLEELLDNTPEDTMKDVGVDDASLSKNSPDVEILAMHSDDSKQYLVTAIVSTYNSEQYIRGCLEDLEAQSISDQLEIIVIDSHSTQDEESIVAEFQQKYTNIKYIRTKERETVYQAWNRAIQASSGLYITNANTDDRHHPRAFEIMVSSLEEDRTVSLVYADSAITLEANSDYESASLQGFFNWPDYDRDLLFKVCYIGPHPMWRRTLHDEYGYFDDDMKSAADYEFWLRLSQYVKFKHIPEVLGLYLYVETSIQNSNQSLSFQESNTARARYWDYSNGPLPEMSGNFIVPVHANNRLTDKPERAALVSVIMPTYNRPEKLRNALMSVNMQSYKHWEVVIVDDGDGSGESVVSEYNINGQFRYFKHKKNMGQSAARNTALGHAKGDIICFLDDDDIIYPDHLETLVNGLRDFSGGVVYTDCIHSEQQHKNGNIVYRKIGNLYSHQEYSRERLYVGNYIPINTIAFRHSYLEKTGLFDVELPSLEDWDLLLRLSKVSNFYHIHKTTAEVRLDARDLNNVSDQGARNYPIVYREIYDRNGDMDNDFVQSQRALTIKHIDEMFQGLVT